MWALSACAEQEPTAPRQTVGKAVSLDDHFETIDEITEGEASLIALARMVPSAAGFHLDETGILNVLVTDPSAMGEARRAIGSLIASGAIIPSESRRPPIAVRLAEYRYSDLSVWRHRALPALFARFPDVMGIGIDQVRNRISIGIDPNGPTSEADILQTADSLGIPQRALDLVPQTPAELDYLACTNAPSPVAGTTEAVYRPLEGGRQIHWGSGSCATMAFVATLGGVRYAATNSHVTATMFRSGSRVFMQGAADGKRIGIEFLDPTPRQCSDNLQHIDCRTDVAFIRLDDTVSAEVGRIVRTVGPAAGASGSPVAQSRTVNSAKPRMYIQYIGNVYPPSVGSTLHKIGRTTGWTYGVVRNACYTQRVAQGSYTPWHANSLVNVVIIPCSIMTTYYSQQGDSGSPVFMWGESYYSGGGDSLVRLEGIHWGHAQFNGEHVSFANAYAAFAQEIDPGGNGNLQITYPVGRPVLTQYSKVEVGRPRVAWTPTTNAVRYIVQKCIDDRTGPGCVLVHGPTQPQDGYNYINTTLTSILDHGGPGVEQYRGLTKPTVERYISYWVEAFAANGVRSGISHQIYFTISNQTSPF